MARLCGDWLRAPTLPIRWEYLALKNNPGHFWTFANNYI